MDEHEWLTGGDPARMLQWLTCTEAWADTGRGSGVKPSDRKLRLFACAVCRQVWDQLTDLRGCAAVEVAERYADGEATQSVFSRAYEAAAHLTHFEGWGLVMSCFWDKQYIVDSPQPLRDRLIPPALQAALLRDLVGNPFRPVSVETSPGSWAVSTVKGTGELTYQQRTNSTVLAIARRAYDEHCPADSLAVLADALEDAGCASEELLRHLRGQERCPVCLGNGGELCTVAVGPSWVGARQFDIQDCHACEGKAWIPLRGPHARGCWVIDLVLGKG